MMLPSIYNELGVVYWVYHIMCFFQAIIRLALIALAPGRWTSASSLSSSHSIYVNPHQDHPRMYAYVCISPGTWSRIQFFGKTHTQIYAHTHIYIIIYIHILDFVIYIRPRLDTRECMIPNMWFHPSQPPWFLGGEAVFNMNCGWDNDHP